MSSPHEHDPSGTDGQQPEPVRLTDPRAMRALAHPARIAIMQHLAIEGPATATECAEVAGLSPSACSYHLRALERYGFVEEDPSGGTDRRHRPWRATAISMTLRTDPERPEAERLASRLLIESFAAMADEVREGYLDRMSEYPREWQVAAGGVNDVLHVTPDELEQIRRRIERVFSEYRRLDPAERPTGARRVQAIADFTPWFAPGGAE
ncbi:MAG: helix-turn-helix domain-containing protein [Actinomycetota bacterium]|nr:helix-turn-helix domain-containing protein [Actinomycetota bacterium]